MEPSLVHVSWSLKGPGVGDLQAYRHVWKETAGDTRVPEPPPCRGGSPARRPAARARAPVSGQPLHGPPGPPEMPGHKVQQRQERRQMWPREKHPSLQGTAMRSSPFIGGEEILVSEYSAIFPQKCAEGRGP